MTTGVSKISSLFLLTILFIRYKGQTTGLRFIVAFQGDSVRFRLVNGRIIYAHRRHVQPMRISVIMHSLEAARQYLLNTAAMEIENADVLDMNAYLDHVNYLEFIRRITTPSNEPDETYAQYRSR